MSLARKIVLAAVILFLITAVTSCEMWEVHTEIDRAGTSLWTQLQQGNFSNAESYVLSHPELAPVWQNTGQLEKKLLKTFISAYEIKEVRVLTQESEEIRDQVTGQRTAHFTVVGPDLNQQDIDELARWSRKQLHAAKTAGVSSDIVYGLMDERTEALMQEADEQVFRYEVQAQHRQGQWRFRPPILPPRLYEQMTDLVCEIQNHLQTAAASAGMTLPPTTEPAEPMPSGQEIWRQKLPGNPTTVTLAEALPKNILVATEESAVMLDQLTGQIQWSYSFPTSIGDDSQNIQIHVADDYLFVALTSNEEKGEVFISSINRYTGKPLWERKLSRDASAEDIKLWQDQIWVKLRTIPGDSPGDSFHTALSAETGDTLYKFSEIIGHNSEHAWVYCQQEGEIRRHRTGQGKKELQIAIVESPAAEPPEMTYSRLTPQSIVAAFENHHPDGMLHSKAYAFERTSGNHLWKTSGNILDVQPEEDLLLLAQHQQVSILNLQTGRPLLERYVGIITDGEILTGGASYVLTRNSVQLLSAEDENGLEKRISDTNIKLHSEGQKLYIIGDNNIRRINTQTGATEWEVESPVSKASSIRSAGDNLLFVREEVKTASILSDSTWLNYYLLDRTTGQIRNELQSVRHISDKNSSPHLYFYSPHVLYGLSKADGTEQFNHVLGKGGLSGKAIMTRPDTRAKNTLAETLQSDVVALTYQPFKVSDGELRFSEYKLKLWQANSGQAKYAASGGRPLLLIDTKVLSVASSDDNGQVKLIFTGPQ